MGTRNTVARQTAPPERRPAIIAPTRAPAPAVTSAQLLQRRLGNQGTANLIARSAMQVSSPHDPAEREATARAAEVMRMPVSATQSVSSGSFGVQRCACEGCGCNSNVQREAAGPGVVPHDVSREIHASMSGGTPLPGGVRNFMEPRFGADFGKVRIHTGERSAQLSENLNAHAFTVGSHIFFGKGQYKPEAHTGKELIAHELTHTIQQGGSAQRISAENGGFIQRDEDKRHWWQKLVDWGETAAWDMVKAVAPGAVPILQKGPAGVIEWIGEKISSALDGIFNALMSPVRAISGVGDTLAALFSPMLTALQTAAVQIAHNDCSPIREAADKIEKTALSVITPIVEKLQPVVATVKEFLKGLWDKFGAPAWEWIKSYAKEQWNQIQWLAGVIKDFYVWIWEKTAWIRSLASQAWTWIKNKLGIGEGPEGQDGLLQWVQGKLEAAWNTLKAKIEPFKKELTAIGLAVGGVLLAISPAGPVLAIGAAVVGAVQGLRWIAANWGKGNIIITARTYIEKSLIPMLMGAANKLAASVARMVGSISSALGSLAGGMVRAVGTLAGSVLRFAVSAVQWLADQANALAAWAGKQLADLSHWLNGALDKLQAFLKQILALLSRVSAVILDIYGLPILLGEKVWNLIPACVRDPIVDFLGPIILGQIELFSELVKDTEAWQKTKVDVMKIIHLVFKDHDLVGAVKATFRLILRVFNIPPELLVSIGQKALDAWDVVSKKPLEFIKNSVRSIGHGFRLLGENLWQDLTDGLQGWLFGELRESKITPPASWTSPKDLFFFALDVLGLSVPHMWELLAKRFDQKKVQLLQKRIGQVVAVIEWINNAIDTTKTPKENTEGIWAKAKEFGGTILSGIAGWVAKQVAKELALMATAAAASGGLSEVLDVLRRVYKALLTAKRYARGVLEMVSKGLDNILDIAAGSVVKVGVEVHKIIKLGMPIVIGFLAEQVGLGGVGAEINKIIQTLRAKVDEGILWFIDKIKAALEAIIGAVKAGVAALFNWDKAKAIFTGDDGKPHSITVNDKAGAPQLIVTSDPVAIRNFVSAYTDKKEKNNPTFRTSKASLLGDIETSIGKAEDTVANIEKLEKANKDDPAIDGLLKTLLTQNKALGELLATLLKGDADVGKMKEKYALEGLTGTYGSMPKPPGDDFTADHQPQAAVLQAAAEFKFFSKVGALATRAKGRAKEGIAINLHKIRHVAGATFGSKGKKTKNDFLDDIKKWIANVESAEAQRAVVVERIKADMKRDVDAMRTVAKASSEHDNWRDIMKGDSTTALDPKEQEERKKVVDEVRQRINSGEREIEAQDIDSLVG